MELRHLEYFVAVAEELSFTRASRRLHVVQSGVSSAIAALERELGAALFDRDRHTVALTDAGLALLPEARATLAAAQAAAEAVAETAAGLRGTLSVGTMISTGPIDVPTVLGRFHAAHPGVLVRLRVAPAGSADLARWVADGTVDLALLSLCGDPPAGVTVRQLAQEPMVLICAPDSPLASTVTSGTVTSGTVTSGTASGTVTSGAGTANAGTVPLASIAGETYIDFPVGWGTRAVIDRAFAAANLDRSVSFEVANYQMAAGLVGHGFGVAFLPASVAAEVAGVAQVRITEDLTWRIQLATAAGKRPSAAARAFLAELLGEPSHRLTSRLSGRAITTGAARRAGRSAEPRDRRFAELVA